MLFPMMLPRGHVLAMAGVTALMVGERLEPPATARWRWRGLDQGGPLCQGGDAGLGPGQFPKVVQRGWLDRAGGFSQSGPAGVLSSTHPTDSD